ncbi:MAG: nitroreductase family protein [Acidimicrobiia bacterium]
MEFAEAVRRRRMVRAFEERPVDPSTLERILDLARRAPSAGFTQGARFLVLCGSAETARFWDATLPRSARDEFPWPGLLRAPVIVLPLASKQAYLDRYAEPDKGWTDRAEARWPVPYWHVDAAFSAMTALLAIVDSGLGALFFGIFQGLDQLREAFGIPAELEPIGALAVGHPAPDRTSQSLLRGRLPYDEMVRFGRWENSGVNRT